MSGDLRIPDDHLGSHTVVGVRIAELAELAPEVTEFALFVGQEVAQVRIAGNGSNRAQKVARAPPHVLVVEPVAVSVKAPYRPGSSPFVHQAEGGCDASVPQQVVDDARLPLQLVRGQGDLPLPDAPRRRGQGDGLDHVSDTVGQLAREGQAMVVAKQLAQRLETLRAERVRLAAQFERQAGQVCLGEPGQLVRDLARRLTLWARSECVRQRDGAAGLSQRLQGVQPAG